MEYEVEGLTQSGVNQRAGMTFATILREMLRQDPDVIMVGEIRDSETARIATAPNLWVVSAKRLEIKWNIDIGDCW